MISILWKFSPISYFISGPAKPPPWWSKMDHLIFVGCCCSMFNFSTFKISSFVSKYNQISHNNCVEKGKIHCGTFVVMSLPIFAASRAWSCNVIVPKHVLIKHLQGHQHWEQRFGVLSISLTISSEISLTMLLFPLSNNICNLLSYFHKKAASKW